MVKATFDALKHCASPRSVATRRGKKVSEIFGRRDTPATGAAPAEEQPNA
jgi:small subunit ribosomal protein S5